MSEPPRILLEHRLKTLKLPTFLREYEKLARQSAQEGLDHVQFLSRLVELELIDRGRRLVERRIKAAKFPTTKSLDSFEFKAIPGGSPRRSRKATVAWLVPHPVRQRHTRSMSAASPDAGAGRLCRGGAAHVGLGVR